MKEVFVILTYISNKIQENQLRNLVFKLKENNKIVFVVSHSHIPDDIIKQCDYYLFDIDNDLIPAWKTNGIWSFNSSSFDVSSPFNVFSYYNYSIAALKLMYSGLILSKQYGYDVAHVIEYDTDFISLEEFNDNLNILSDYDCVFYRHKSGDTTFPIGHIHSFNISNYSFLELFFNSDKLINDITFLDEGYMAERITYNNLLKNKNCYIKHQENIDTSKLFLNLSLPYTENTLRSSVNCVCINPKNNEGFWFLHNTSNKPLSPSLIVNDSEYYKSQLDPNNFSCVSIGDFSNVKDIKFFNNNKLIKIIDSNIIKTGELALRSSINFKES